MDQEALRLLRLDRECLLACGHAERLVGTCNGDAAELRSLRSPKVNTFSGMALVVYRRIKDA